MFINSFLKIAAPGGFAAQLAGSRAAGAFRAAAPEAAVGARNVAKTVAPMASNIQAGRIERGFAKGQQTAAAPRPAAPPKPLPIKPATPGAAEKKYNWKHVAGAAGAGYLASKAMNSKQE